MPILIPKPSTQKFLDVQSRLAAELIKIFPELVLVLGFLEKLQGLTTSLLFLLYCTNLVQAMWTRLVLVKTSFIDAFNKPSETNLLLHFVWFSSHCATLLLSIVSFTKFFQKQDATFCCRAALASSSVTYLVVIYRHITVLVKTDGPPITSTTTNAIPLSQALKSENAYLLLTCFLALNSNIHQAKILSFVVYAFLNIFSTILDEYIHGTALSNALLPLLLFIEEPLLLLAATAEICMLPFTIAENITSQKFIDLVMNVFIFGLRLELSICLRAVSLTNLHKMDNMASSLLLPRLISLPLTLFFNMSYQLLASPSHLEDNSARLNNTKQRKGRVASLQFGDTSPSSHSY